MGNQLRLILFLAFVIVSIGRSYATHIRAGEIIAERIQTPQGLTFRFTIIGFTDNESPIIFAQGEIDFGDGTDPQRLDELGNLFTTDLGEMVDFNQVVVEHTFPAPGLYTISYMEANRNADIKNMDNSVNTPFYVESQILIDPILGPNNSPTLLVPPIDRGQVGTAFEHNPGAFDVDGDSLSYRIVIPRQERGIEVLNYVFPNDTRFGGTTQEGDVPTIFTLDPLTGTVLWDAPGEPGEYNIAFEIEEWRKVGGEFFKVGFVVRDMQIIIEESENEPPVVTVPKDTCIEAGTFLEGVIVGEDPNNQEVRLEAFGGPLVQVSNPATFNPEPPVFQPQPAVGFFEWQTDCSHVRARPYQMVFKASDQPPPGPRLVDFEIWDITVVAPAPELLSASATNQRTMELEWAPYTFCDDFAERMQIWRRVDSFEFEAEGCQVGIPPGSGYELIGEVGIDTTFFVDDNAGKGLAFGARYCYRLVAQFPFPEGGESFASNEVCEIIEATAPVITNVSIENTDSENGEIFVRWTSPFDIDQTLFPPPYSYQVLRSQGLTGTAFEPVTDVIADTVLTETGINTLDLGYNYRIVLFDATGARVDTSFAASSVRLNPVAFTQGVELLWEAEVPWSNNVQDFPYHFIFRDNVIENDPDSIVLIDSVNVNMDGFRYLDEGQFNNTPLSDQKVFCYFITTQGSYGNDKIPEPLRNNSQIVCVQPNDTIPPCSPVALTVEDLDNCEEILANLPCGFSDFSNTLTWELENDPQCLDVRTFNVYFSETGEEDTFELLASGITESQFVDDNLPSFARCYKVSSVDRSGNESELSEMICRDNCPFFELPNVFTPNGDLVNDTFRVFRNDDKCTRFIESVNFKVVNRWGREVFVFNSSQAEGEANLLIDWDGRTNDGTALATGIYYYEADVVFDVLDPNQKMGEFKGWIHLLR